MYQSTKVLKNQFIQLCNKKFIARATKLSLMKRLKSSSFFRRFSIIVSPTVEFFTPYNSHHVDKYLTSC